MVNVQANYDWGGQGCLGADVGYGLLHRLVEEDPNFDDLLQQNEENQSLLQEEEPVHNMSNLSVNEEESIVTSEHKIHDPTEHFTKTIQQKQTIPQRPEESVEVQLFAKEPEAHNHDHSHDQHEHRNDEPHLHDIQSQKAPQRLLPKTIPTSKKIHEPAQEQKISQSQPPAQASPKITPPEKLSPQPPTKVVTKPVEMPRPVLQQPKPVEMPQPILQQPKPVVHPKSIITSKQPIPAPRQEPPRTDAQVDEWSNIGKQTNGEQTADALFGNDLSKPLEDELSELLSGDLR